MTRGKIIDIPEILKQSTQLWHRRFDESAEAFRLFRDWREAGSPRLRTWCEAIGREVSTIVETSQDFEWDLRAEAEDYWHARMEDEAAIKRYRRKARAKIDLSEDLLMLVDRSLKKHLVSGHILTPKDTLAAIKTLAQIYATQSILTMGGRQPEEDALDLEGASDEQMIALRDALKALE